MLSASGYAIANPTYLYATHWFLIIFMAVMLELGNERNSLLVGIDDTVVQVHIVLCA